MSDEIDPLLPKSTNVGTMLWSRTRQPNLKTCPHRTSVTHPGTARYGLVGILAAKTLQALAVVLQKERRLMSQHRNSAYCWSD